ncbi:carboxypeptidase regulatory-like domain-containing protein [Xanthomonas dyei]|uniref:carboxypeptidase regulatory-like domain-containing protein n=1 Tax=Xanthomonas dyei TaxID=743699 RepID=UPI001E2B2D41|nr:carboxypeptidase regulatory-like domain-containing protein [Xanthomonas dyei]MCC4634444.1 carboxypeptidase regulatory-like domain-containing protein [Xanthomonas dyei pv. eucalypti]
MTLAPPWLVAAVLALLVVIGWIRLLRAHAAQPRARGRLWWLLAAQPMLAALLYPVLLPPPRAGTAGVLQVATAGTRAAQIRAGAQWVALPEAPRLPGVARVPDLATALRRNPGTASVVVHGDGLPARDRDGLAGVAVQAALGPPVRGLVAAWAPAAVAPGQLVAITAQVQGMANAQVDLLDPSGQRVDRARPDARGQVRLRGLANAPGQVLFALQLRDAAGGDQGRLNVPVQIAAVPPARVALLAGAPQPEFKYLRRWASDAGLAARSQVSVSAGLQLGDAISLDAASLDRLDVLVLDTRRLLAMPTPQRQAVSAAIARGLGVLVQAAEPADAATRTALGALGLAVTGGDASTAVTLAPAGTPGDARAQTAPPPLQRRNLQPQGSDAVIAARASDGTALGWWRSVGRGRIGVSVVQDSYTLVLAGQRAVHAQLWAQLLGAVARPAGAPPSAVQEGWSGQRMTVCDLTADASVGAPGGSRQPLLAERTGNPAHCAGYWPATTGWHRLYGGPSPRWIYVRAPADAPALYRHQLRAHTLALAAAGVSTSATTHPAPQPGPRWPWLLLWLAVATATWWLERRRG